MSIVKRPFDRWSPAIVTASWQDLGPAEISAARGIASFEARLDIGFLITADPITANGTLGCMAIQLPHAPALRVDEVAFPVGAIANRHTHRGGGWRHLISGTLQIESNGHQDIKQPGDSWFEPENTPVRAIALQDTGETRFIRAMVIPAEYIGRSTFRLVDPKDAELPRIQVTHRHFDLPFQVEAG